MKTKMFFLLLIPLIIFNACGTSKIYISNSLPAEMQQRIHTGKVNDVAFEFIGHPDGDKVKVDLGPMWDSEFQLNKPFKGLLTELLNSKYEHINNNSNNKIKIKITNLESQIDNGGLGSDGLYSLSMRVLIEVKRDTLDKKRFSYDIGVPIAYGFEGANAAFKSNLGKGIKELLIKFIVSIDKYLDSAGL